MNLKSTNHLFLNQNKDMLYYFIGGLIGVTVFLLIYGLEPLNVLNDQWLLNGGDLTQHYIGWTYYRNSDWRFPIGLIDGLIYPKRISIMYMDSIPLFAVIFKFFSPILPDTFNYFGWFGLFSYFMQGYLSIVLMRKASIPAFQCLAGSVFFVCSVPIIQRMFTHTSLTSHFLILTGFILLLDRIPNNWCLETLKWGGLLTLAAAIHAYFVPMLGIMLMFYLLYLAIEYRKILYCVTVLVGSLTILFVYMFIIGAFYGGVTDAFDAGGLDFFNANLNTLFNPRDASNLLPSLPYATDGQYEGFAYAGFGVIVLFIISMIAVCVLFLRRKQAVLNQHDIRFIKIMTIMLLTFILISTGASITANQYTLLSIHLPGFILKIWNAFHASGRFIWPVMYAIMLLSVYVSYICISRKCLVMTILTICCVLHIVDIVPYMKLKGKTMDFKEQYASTFQKSAWAEWGDKCEKLIFMTIGSPREKRLLLQAFPPSDVFNLGIYANQNKLLMSDFYVSRKDTVALLEYQESIWEDILSGQIDKDALYIFSEPPYSLYFDSTLDFFEIDGFIVGTHPTNQLKKTYDNCKKLSSLSQYDIMPKNSRFLSAGEAADSGTRMLHYQGISYGPYIKLSAGQYRITITGDNLTAGQYDIMSHGGEYGVIENAVYEENMVSYMFNLTASTDNLEFRCFNYEDELITLDQILLEKIDGIKLSI